MEMEIHYFFTPTIIWSDFLFLHCKTTHEQGGIEVRREEVKFLFTFLLQIRSLDLLCVWLSRQSLTSQSYSLLNFKHRPSMCWVVTFDSSCFARANSKLSKLWIKTGVWFERYSCFTRVLYTTLKVDIIVDHQEQEALWALKNYNEKLDALHSQQVIVARDDFDCGV